MVQIRIQRESGNIMTNDGNVLHYQNFYEGGRNGGVVANCIVIVKRVEYKWFDVKCHPLIPFICEIDI